MIASKDWGSFLPQVDNGDNELSLTEFREFMRNPKVRHPSAFRRGHARLRKDLRTPACSTGLRVKCRCNSSFEKKANGWPTFLKNQIHI